MFWVEKEAGVLVSTDSKQTSGTGRDQDWVLGGAHNSVGSASSPRSVCPNFRKCNLQFLSHACRGQQTHGTLAPTQEMSDCARDGTQGLVGKCFRERRKPVQMGSSDPVRLLLAGAWPSVSVQQKTTEWTTDHLCVREMARWRQEVAVSSLPEANWRSHVDSDVCPA